NIAAVRGVEGRAGGTAGEGDEAPVGAPRERLDDLRGGPLLVDRLPRGHGELAEEPRGGGGGRAGGRRLGVLVDAQGGRDRRLVGDAEAGERDRGVRRAELDRRTAVREAGRGEAERRLRRGGDGADRSGDRPAGAQRAGGAHLCGVRGRRLVRNAEQRWRGGVRGAGDGDRQGQQRDRGRQRRPAQVEVDAAKHGGLLNWVNLRLNPTYGSE